jgi:hypothetical protein
MTLDEENYMLRQVIRDIAVIACRRQHLGNPKRFPRALPDGTLDPSKVLPHEVPPLVEAIDRLLRDHDTDRCGYKLELNKERERAAEIVRTYFAESPILIGQVRELCGRILEGK